MERFVLEIVDIRNDVAETHPLLHAVMITAAPYFISRLSESLAATFMSYLSVAFNLTNVAFLYRATVTAKQVRLSHLVFHMR
jgi:hypothetical protein